MPISEVVLAKTGYTSLRLEARTPWNAGANSAEAKKMLNSAFPLFRNPVSTKRGDRI